MTPHCPPTWYEQQLPLMHEPQIHHTGASWLAAHAGRIVPAISTGTALALARIWHTQGAAGSWGDAALMLALAGGAFAAGCVSAAHRHGDPVTTAMAFTASGACAVLGPAAYTQSWALACLLWLVTTVLVYAVSSRHWRAARQAREQRAHELALRRMELGAGVQVAAIEGQSRVQALAYGLSLSKALEARQQADPGTYDPAVLLQAGLPMLPAAEADTRREDG